MTAQHMRRPSATAEREWIVTCNGCKAELAWPGKPADLSLDEFTHNGDCTQRSFSGSYRVVDSGNDDDPLPF
jgi:hypothetical protein